MNGQGKPLRVVHYLNQFFGGLGGEDKAGLAPQWFEGARGPGLLLERLAPEVEIVATVVAGDNYMAEQIDRGVAEVVGLIQAHRADLVLAPDLLLAGPAFNAGRYGLACAGVCEAVETQLGLPAVTALYPENPAVEDYRRRVTIVEAGENVLDMQRAIATMARVGGKRVRGEPIVTAADGTIARGVRENYFAAATGAERAIEMLLDKLAGRAFETEYALPVFDRVPPAKAVADLRKATVALVTSGGIVPRGNPDRIEAASASKYGEYSLEGLDRLTSETHQSVHGGYDPTYANEDPNRVLPLDVLRDLEREGRIGRLHDRYFATVGNATSVDLAKRFGKEIAAKLFETGVDAIVFTST